MMIGYDDKDDDDYYYGHEDDDDDDDWNLGKIRFLFIIGEGYELWDGIPLSPLCLLGKLREVAKTGGWHSKNGSSLLPFCCSLLYLKFNFVRASRTLINSR